MDEKVGVVVGSGDKFFLANITSEFLGRLGGSFMLGHQVVPKEVQKERGALVFLTISDGFKFPELQLFQKYKSDILRHSTISYL